MAKYLYYGNFVGDGLKGLVKEGGSGRVAAVKKLFESVGGKLECYYYAFGEYDYFIIADVPDNVSAASVSLTVSASGLVRNNTIPLMTPEEMDETAKKFPTYRGPGQ
ncbi:MAG TPA: GYD domain-containing protein [Syntrophobacteraceae bacterium]|nr:GYD domain-containing protein [Syntrophobacteraceae bacterium]